MNRLQVESHCALMDWRFYHIEDSHILDTKTGYAILPPAYSRALYISMRIPWAGIYIVDACDLPEDIIVKLFIAAHEGMEND